MHVVRPKTSEKQQFALSTNNNMSCVATRRASESLLRHKRGEPDDDGHHAWDRHLLAPGALRDIACDMAAEMKEEESPRPDRATPRRQPTVVYRETVLAQEAAGARVAALDEDESGLSLRRQRHHARKDLANSSGGSKTPTGGRRTRPWQPAATDGASAEHVRERERLTTQTRVTDALDALYDHSREGGGGDDGGSSVSGSHLEYYDEQAEARTAARERRRAARELARRRGTPEWQLELEANLFPTPTQRYRDSVMEVVQVASAGRSLSRRERSDPDAAVGTPIDSMCAGVGGDGTPALVSATRVDPSLDPSGGGAAATVRLPMSAPSKGRARAHSAPRSALGDERRCGYLQPRLATPAAYAGDEYVGLPVNRTVGRARAAWRAGATDVGAASDRSGGPPLPRPPGVSRTADTRLSSYGGLFHAIASGALRPLRGSYLLMLHRTGEALGRRQMLPESAFYSLEELKGLLGACVRADGVERGMTTFGSLLVSVSAQWASDEQCDDAEHFHLRRVGQMTETYLFGHCRPIFQRLQRAASGRGAVASSRVSPDFALLWDTASLFQPPYSAPHEIRLHNEGMRASMLWFAHSHTAVWVQPELPHEATILGRRTPYARSALRAVERAAMAIAKAARHLRLDLSKHPGTRPPPPGTAGGAPPGVTPGATPGATSVSGGATARATPAAEPGGGQGHRDAMLGSWEDIHRCAVLPACTIAVDPPRLPHAVDAALHSGELEGASAEESAQLGTLYHEVFTAATHHVRRLDWSCAGWGAAQMGEVCGFMSCCTRCTHVDLSHNDLREPAAGALLVEMMRQPGCPVTRLSLCHTGVCGEVVSQLLQVARLKAIDLSELPLYTSREVAQLSFANGQLQGQPRLLLAESGASAKRMQKARQADRPRAVAEWRARSAHRLGWEHGWEHGWEATGEASSEEGAADLEQHHGTLQPRRCSLYRGPQRSARSTGHAGYDISALVDKEMSRAIAAPAAASRSGGRSGAASRTTSASRRRTFDA